jgi:branched-chain amino acid transport system permease protein
MVIAQIVNGLMLGSLYALIALGYAMVLGILGIFNMAHAEVFMGGAVLGWLIITKLHLSLALSIPVVIVGGAILGLMTEFFCVRRSVAVGSYFGPIATTLGFGIILTTVVANWAGANPLPISVAFQFTQIQIGEASFPLTNIIVFFTSLFIMTILAYFLKKTSLGIATRAVGENPEVSQLLGINAIRIIQITFMISGLIGTLSGLLFGVMTGAAHPYMGEVAGLKGICLVIIGGMGSMTGAVIAAFIGGIAEVLTSVYWSVKYADGVLWLIMFIILLFRPLGLMGKAEELQRLE